MRPLDMPVCFWDVGTGIVRMGGSGTREANSGGIARLEVRCVGVLFFANGRFLPEQPASVAIPTQIVSRQAMRRYFMCVG